MDIPTFALDNFFNISGHFLYWPIFLWAIVRAPWKRVLVLGTNIYFGVCVCVLLIWQLKVELDVGLSLHILGATLMTLMFGWQLAIIGLAMVLLGTSIRADLGFGSFGVNGLICSVIPVFVSYWTTVLVYRFLPKNFFIYIFLSGYANAAITQAVVGFVSVIVFVIAADQTFEYLLGNYLAAYLMILFPEAFITGTVLTMLVVYFPKSIMSFNDKIYLEN